MALVPYVPPNRYTQERPRELEEFPQDLRLAAQRSLGFGGPIPPPTDYLIPPEWQQVAGRQHLPYWQWPHRRANYPLIHMAMRRPDVFHQQLSQHRRPDGNFAIDHISANHEFGAVPMAGRRFTSAFYTTQQPQMLEAIRGAVMYGTPDTWERDDRSQALSFRGPILSTGMMGSVVDPDQLIRMEQQRQLRALPTAQQALLGDHIDPNIPTFSPAESASIHRVRQQGVNHFPFVGHHRDPGGGWTQGTPTMQALFTQQPESLIPTLDTAFPRLSHGGRARVPHPYGLARLGMGRRKAVNPALLELVAQRKRR